MAVFQRYDRALRRLLIATPAIAMLAGCAVFLDYTAAAGVDVRVVDARTGQPIPGAKVTLMPDTAFDGASPRSVISDASGAAHIEAITTRAYFVPFPQASLPMPGKLKVEVSGYEIHEGPDTTFSRQGDDHPRVQIIALMPASTN